MMAGPWHHTFLTELADVQAWNECKDPSCKGPSSGGRVLEDRFSARRLHKADREKLRRDKLNEQFSELANALDPDRPKNDKSTILGESIQVVKDLRKEVKRLKTEHTSLLEESADLTQEKNELREEKASLKSETAQLQSQMQQCLRSSPPWMGMDPSLILGPTPTYPYPISAPQPVSLAPSDSNHVGGLRAPLVSPSPYMPIPLPGGSFDMHSSLQPYVMFGNLFGDGGNPYMPFSGFPPPVTSHSHIERPYAQYPSSVQHPAPGYGVQVSPRQGSQLSRSAGSPLHKPCVAGIAVIPDQNDASNALSKVSNDHSPSPPSSPRDVPGELEENNSRSIAADDAGSPARQEVRETAAGDVKAIDTDIEVCKGKTLSSPSSTFMIKEKLGFFSEKSRLSMITGQDLAGILDMENDSILRPPAA